MRSFFKKARGFFRSLGPGIITGAADDDPSGIATYTQTGAQFGYGQLWTAIFTLPLMAAVQEACARIGAVTGRGLAAAIKKEYGAKVLYAVLGLVLAANIINIGADLGAMGAAAALVVPLDFALLTLFFTAVILALEIFTSYRAYARILKWFTLALLAYPLTLFLVRQPWGELLRATFVPHVEFTFGFFFIITGVLGTTISPYMFFWEASEEVEEERARHMLHGGLPHPSPRFMRALRIDNFVGMLSSQAAMWCIVVVAGTVLHAGGVTNVSTAAEAARALEPLVQTFPNAGFLAKVIFAFGVVGLGFLAVPVLSASAAYALAETLNWHEGLNLRLRRARGFYGIITIATLVGLMINFIGIDPIRALIFAAVFNGIAAVPLLFLIVRIVRNKAVMGAYRSGPFAAALMWTTLLLMAVAAVGLLVLR